MIVPSLLLALGLAFMIAPGFFAKRPRATAQSRLEELRAGAPERYFEEQRDLLTYKATPRFLRLWRISGAAIAITAAGVLIIRSGIAG